jgi:two-component system, OmpR family, sensor kinase
MLTSVHNRFAWRADQGGRSIVVGMPEDLTVTGDRLRLEQALGNLVENALRHGDGTVRLQAGTANGSVALHVRDDGPGFPEDFLDRAFERFSRPSDSRSGGGAGLGLAIVAAVALAHGGEAHARNVNGRGADVWIQLPDATCPSSRAPESCA